MGLFKAIRSLFFNDEIYNRKITERLTEEEFKTVERILKKLKSRKYECLVVDFLFADFFNGYRFLQTARNGKGFKVEVGVTLSDNTYHIFVKRKESLADTINIFKEICVNEHFPDLSQWEDLTDEILKKCKKQ